MTRLPPGEMRRAGSARPEEKTSRKPHDFEGDPLRREAETMGERRLTDHRAETACERAFSFPKYQHRVAVARQPSPPWPALGARRIAPLCRG